MPTKRIAIVPGSFDPITYGHIDIVERAAAEYDKVFLAVTINPSKEYLFSITERTAIAEAALRPYQNVEVIASEGMLWKLAKELGACALVKGYRNEVDYEYEMKMAEFNLEHNPDAPTVLYRANETLEHVSSTVVRDRIQKGLSLDAYLPKDAVEEMKKILNSRA